MGIQSLINYSILILSYHFYQSTFYLLIQSISYLVHLYFINSSICYHFTQFISYLTNQPSLNHFYFIYLISLIPLKYISYLLIQPISYLIN